MVKLLKIPRLNEDIELLQNDNIYYLYHRFSNKVIILENEVAVDIVNHIDSINSISNIIEMMTDKYQISDIKELENDVDELLSILQKEDFVVY
jgi:hypothetical protein